MFSIQDCLSNGKKMENLFFHPEGWELEVTNSLMICDNLLGQDIPSSHNQD